MQVRTKVLAWLTVPVAAAGILAGAGAPPGGPVPEEHERTFSRSNLYIEYNSTAEDIGMQVSLDGVSWKSLRIYDPSARKILDIACTRSLRLQGLTELFFESSEPPLKDVPLEVFLARFPAGEYEFEGITIDDEEIDGTAVFTHNIPDPPVILWPAEGAVVDPEKLVVCWEDIADPPGSRIVTYQLIVAELEGAKRAFSVFVPASVTSVTVPPEFLQPNTNYEFEVLAIEAGNNQTITSSVFSTEPR